MTLRIVYNVRIERYERYRTLYHGDAEISVEIPSLAVAAKLDASAMMSAIVEAAVEAAIEQYSEEAQKAEGEQ